MALPVPPPPPAIGSAAPPPPVAAVHTPPPPPPPMAQPAAVPPPPMTAQAPVAPPAPAPVAPPPPVAQVAPAPVQGAPWEDQGAVTVAAPVAPLAPVPAAPPAPIHTQELVPAQAQGTDMTAPVPGGGAMVEALAAQGFVGLDFGFGSLPIVSLDQGAFKLSDGTSLGEEFYCQMQQSRQKYLFKTALAQNDPRHALCYSYDGITDTKGASVQDQIDAWTRMGIAMEKKVYLEVFAILTNQDTVLLSIPPTSVRRFSALIATMAGRGLSLTETWVKVSKGARVTNVAVPFVPWAFSIYEG